VAGTDPPHAVPGRGSGAAFARIAGVLDDAVPFTRPEVVLLKGSARGVQLQVGEDEYLLLTFVGGRWMCGNVYVDPATGELVTDPRFQRLMRESLRSLPVLDPDDVESVVDRLLWRATTEWEVTEKDPFATERERRFAADALVKLRSRDPGRATGKR